MKLWTYGELKDKLQKDIAIEDEQFVVAEELLGYFNEAIDQAEQEVLGLYEDYFLTRDFLPLVAGTEEYELPSDIYAEKIRRIVYRVGSTIYEVKRLRDWKKFEMYADLNENGSSADYGYMLYNPSAGQSKLLLVPPSRETSSAAMTVWHIRNANVLVGENDVLDIPESANFILQYVKTRVYEKEGHFALEDARAKLEQERDLLRSTLAAMVPDANNEIEMDTSMYEEMS